MKKVINLLCFTFVFIFINTYYCYAASVDCSNIPTYGETSNNVKVLQNTLNAVERCGLPVTGYFGDMTKSCLSKFQRNQGLSGTGVVNIKTCNKLSKINVSGSVINYANANNVRGIVVGDKVNIRRAPSTNSSVLRTVARGNILTIVGTESNWYQIKTKSGMIGYIRQDLLAKKFVLVDISMQRVYYFDAGKKRWATNVVTGNRGNHDTPVGTYNMSRSYFGYHTYLVGNNDDGSSYRAYVDYWMPFILSVGIGFHDATWRPTSDYTKTEFMGNGSHGCVNMQHDAAKKLYNSGFNNITVIVRK